jgi:hypothetical protein
VASSLFERLSKNRPPPIEKAREVSPAQKLLDWLQHWGETTVSARDIYTYGPRPREREKAINQAKILVEHGWLSPTKNAPVRPT